VKKGILKANANAKPSSQSFCAVIRENSRCRKKKKEVKPSTISVCYTRKGDRPCRGGDGFDSQDPEQATAAKSRTADSHPRPTSEVNGKKNCQGKILEGKRNKTSTSFIGIIKTSLERKSIKTGGRGGFLGKANFVFTNPNRQGLQIRGAPGGSCGDSLHGKNTSPRRDLTQTRKWGQKAA